MPIPRIRASKEPALVSNIDNMPQRPKFEEKKPQPEVQSKPEMDLQLREIQYKLDIILKKDDDNFLALRD